MLLVVRHKDQRLLPPWLYMETQEQTIKQVRVPHLLKWYQKVRSDVAYWSEFMQESAALQCVDNVQHSTAQLKINHSRLRDLEAFMELYDIDPESDPESYRQEEPS